MMDILMSMYDWANEAFKVVLEVAWFIGWRFFILYSIYVVKGEQGLGQVLVWICVWCAFFGSSLKPLGLDSLITLMNVMVGACFFVGIGIGGLLLGMFGAWFGYSSTVKGGFVNNLFNNDK